MDQAAEEARRIAKNAESGEDLMHIYAPIGIADLIAKCSS